MCASDWPGFGRNPPQDRSLLELPALRVELSGQTVKNLHQHISQARAALEDIPGRENHWFLIVEALAQLAQAQHLLARQLP